MKKFRFQLETVQKVRKSREQDALRVLAECQARLRDEVAQRDALVTARNESLLRRESLGEVPVTALAFRMEEDFITGTKVRIAHAEQAIRRAEKRMQKAMQEYLVAKRATKTIERLRERAMEKFKRERAKHEQKALDDLYTMRARMTAELDLLGGEADATQEQGLRQQEETESQEVAG